MTTDLEEQEDELLALQSIFDSEEFIRNESKSAGQIRVFVELPGGFTVSLKGGERLRQYEISHLPPLVLTFELPQNYPSSSPPSFTLTCSWLTHTQLSTLSTQLSDLYQATGGTVVLFSWVQFLREDALGFLDISNLLELPSDEHSTQYNSQGTQNAVSSEPTNNQHTPNSDDKSCNVSDPHKPDLCAPSLEVQNPDMILAGGQNASGCDTDYQKTLPYKNVFQNDSNDSDQTALVLDVRGAEQAFQTTEFTADHQNDLSAAAASLLPSSSSSGPPDQSEQRAASLPGPCQASGLSLTPSQIILSQLLIYNVAQKQKVFNSTVFDCSVCFIGWLGSECVQLSECGHIFCRTCLADFFKLQITEGNIRRVTCPQADCTAIPTPAQVKSLVGEQLFSRYDRLLLQSTLDCMPDVVYCPRRSCGSAVILEKSSTAAMCSVCDFAFCVTCRKTYHGTDDCQAKEETKKTEEYSEQGRLAMPQSAEGLKALQDDYASGSKERRRLLEARYSRRVLVHPVEETLSDCWMANNSKNCPHCFSRIHKDGGCNVMTCSKCGQQFCWACLKRLSGSSAKHFKPGRCRLFEYIY